MFLIAESGSTKTDWILIDNHRVLSEFRTDGLNPVHLSAQKISEKISFKKDLINLTSSIKELHFFGAGCGNEEGRKKMEGVLTSLFPASEIFVENDLMAAAIATCNNEKGIV